jgi:hypothetical protein
MSALAKRLAKLEAQSGSDDEVYLVRWEDGREVAVLDLRGTGVTCRDLLESITKKGKTIAGH